MLASVVFAFTVGNLGFDGFNFLDDLQHAGKRQWMYVFMAGLIFNLGNMLLMAAVSVAGLAVAFPMGMGMALLLGTVVGIASRPAGNSLLLGMGCLLILTSIIVNAISYRIMGVAKHEELARAGRAKSTRRPNPVKGIILAIAAGILIGGFVPLLDKARQGDLGLGPYAAGFIFAFGVFFSTFVYKIFFMNLPVEGEPVEFGEYFNGRLRQHLAGPGVRIHLVHRPAGGTGFHQRARGDAGRLDAPFLTCPGIAGAGGAVGNPGLPRVQERRHPREAARHADAGSVPLRYGYDRPGAGSAPQGIVSPIRKFRVLYTTGRRTADAHSPR